MYTNKESITWKCLHYQSSTYKHHSRQIKTRKLKVLKKIFWREPHCLFPFSSSGNIVMSQQVLTTKLTFYYKVANCLMFKQKTSRIDKNMQMIHIRKLQVPSDSLPRKISWDWLTSKYWGTQRHKWQKKKKWSPFAVTRQSHFLPLGHMGMSGSHYCLPRKGRTHNKEEWSFMVYTEAKVMGLGKQFS